MCGRYGRHSPAEQFARIVSGKISARLSDNVSYNRPPGTFQLITLVDPETGVINLGPAWWGFIPGWAGDTKLAPINARSETASEKKLFAKSFEHQRCVVAADYWIEWKRGGEQKQPYAIRPADAQPFFFAGIWSKASRLPADHSASGEVTFAILTGEPSEDIAHIHNRQPQALTGAGARSWIDPDIDVDQGYEILREQRYSSYEYWPIGQRVGSPKNDDPSILDKVNIG
ncbi:SOS response-associated peptidase [Endozoicomonas sp. G2_2]|jgi:putative SOS response-associated peptidase YedK|uniref:SOS response-associated peptidase n=1 Tax=Endozoicomonas sp. G2_2 TaxID=2821092 RepID=UPI001ADBBA08|nr:SOS response-associated peptidase [Endozoicomonas sp. G2_2]MBO9471588.1 SOS response-associated peptidase [Endozoicomonas sp. G2_2]